VACPAEHAARRLALARALQSPVRVLILDERYAGRMQRQSGRLSTLDEVAEPQSVMLLMHRLTGVERLDRICPLSGWGRWAVAGSVCDKPSWMGRGE
jgi:ABC-type transport system involved in cytochrome bd biosynthesis fused ATPase/permease subunit